MPRSPRSETSISNLRPNHAATIELSDAPFEPFREITQRDHQEKRVRNGRFEEDTGGIRLVLWGDEVEFVLGGGNIRIFEGRMMDYQRLPQILLDRQGGLRSCVGKSYRDREPTASSCAYCDCPGGCCHYCACYSVTWRTWRVARRARLACHASSKVAPMTNHPL